ncbi:peptidase M36 fungalysin [Hymenobacter roseosalivarius DSM 11622]|uniref:Peptidase M36 fungalysin n=1 Tax=Hymenobacter roseosalivarius DSM 11622 TaxID=645990 RepID=A0A1W1VRW2_9BACT|nr:T9SS-dependent M36 family metallopeptidase [Hymenobacter roseosalivarius]SMB96088.1 peptidase M36 fungalysin [Hymenobacter roseosalivarius DSM 11622]
MKKLLPLLARLVLVAILLMGGFTSFSQGKGNSGKKPVPQAAIEHLKKNKQKLGLEDADIADIALSSESESKKSGVKHLYLQQQYQGIEIHNALTTMSMTSDGEVVNMGNRFEKGVSKKVKAKGSKMTAEAAVAAAAKHLSTGVKQPLTVQQKGEGQDEAVLLSTGGVSLEPIPARLVYQPMEDGSLRLAWEVTIYELDALNWWNIRVDAATGEFLDKDNLVVHCEFDNDGPNGVHIGDSYNHKQAEAKSFNFATAVTEAPAANFYNVYPIVTESPSHGPRVFINTDAADRTASPKGWHHTPQGIKTTTRGNNVYAYEDPNGLNPFPNATNNYTVLNYSPDGGPNLKFDFPVDFTKQPDTYVDAATTNLFYWSNIIHDMWYQYGFDEASGNFQFDNFGKGGLGNDFVRAEAQDARVTSSTGPQRNNANFGTPADGSLPRMQMYLWNGIPDKELFKVTAPSPLVGAYPALEATFSRKLTPVPVAGKLVVAATATGVSQEGCSMFTNAADIAGNIAVVYRGTCGFANKVQNAQIAGAIAVVVINNAPGAPIAMGGAPAPGTPAIIIPAVMIGQAEGKLIRDVLDAKTDVTVSLKNDGSGPELDGDFDNGIIAHEVGHGISNRLTGGPNIVNCLSNAEQMGEGWSDWFGLMMTTKPGDIGTKVRGIGTYASGQPTTARGIRPAPYSTDFTVNNFTYAATNNTAISQPHGIGFVWATMIWDMTWALVDKYGYDADLYFGKGGNNMAMQLVMDGLKLQVCTPGFVDGRDAILLADRINYGGANQELIWKAFAKRGLGFSAKQGLSTSRTDQVEAFDLPPMYLCTTPLTVAAVATSDVFTGGDAKVVYLGYGPQNVMLRATGDATNKYTWSPAAGLSDLTIANPVFTPTAAGTYTFTVKAVNEDQCTKTATITIKVVNVVCGNRGNKVQVCFKGNEMCVDAADAKELLTRKDGGATLGTCGPKAKAADASLTAADALATDGLTASPNPTNANTTLAFTLAESGAYRLEVMNMQGAVMSVVAQGKGEAGQRISHEFSKGRLATGVYMVRLTSGKQSKFTRVVLQD